MEWMVSTMTAEDWPAAAEIYQQGIDGGNATFATRVPASWEEWSGGKLAVGRLAARGDGRVLGWAALSPISSRAVYAGVAEVSVYVSPLAQGQGVGSLLLQELIRVSEAHGIWTLQAGIFPENEASLHLHQRHGFRVVGWRERLGRMEQGPLAGQWRDVLLLERRSRVAGV